MKMESDEEIEHEEHENFKHSMINHLYYVFITSRFVTFVRSMDTQITNNFRQAEIYTRPAQGNGLWTCALLPSILIFYDYLYNVSPLYRLMTCISIGLFAYSILYLMFFYVSCLVLRDTLSAGCLSGAFLSALPIYLKLEQSLIVAIVFPLMTIYIYTFFLKTALVKCPKTFTIGEAMLVSQGSSLVIVMMIAKVVLGNYYPEYAETDPIMHLINTYVFTVFSTVGLIVAVLYNLEAYHRNIYKLTFIISVAILYTLIVLHVSYGFSCIPAFVHFVFGNSVRIRLFCFWLGLVLLSVFIIVVRTRRGDKANTVTRKLFHLLATLVFISGILLDVYFMTLAAGLIFGVLILIEALRKAKIDPVSPILQYAFDIYKDHKDSGSFAMTAIYLYVGLACPLVIVPREARNPELEWLSGVLAIGIGDTAASWFGEKYGIIKWPDGDRTMEGTAFNVIAQMVAIHMLHIFELLDSPYMYIRTAIAATVSALVEARTTQVDNLVLPLITILAFQTTTIL